MKTNASKAISPVVINKIAKYLFNGFSLDEISVLTGLSDRDLKALNSGKNGSAVRKGSLELKNIAIERIKAGRGKLNGLIWFMERRFPRQFSKPETQISLSAGTTTNNVLVVRADIAESLVNRSNTTLEEINQLIKDKNPDITVE